MPVGSCPWAEHQESKVRVTERLPIPVVEGTPQGKWGVILLPAPISKSPLEPLAGTPEAAPTGNSGSADRGIEESVIPGKLHLFERSTPLGFPGL